MCHANPVWTRLLIGTPMKTNFIRHTRCIEHSRGCGSPPRHAGAVRAQIDCHFFDPTCAARGSCLQLGLVCTFRPSLPMGSAHSAHKWPCPKAGGQDGTMSLRLGPSCVSAWLGRRQARAAGQHSCPIEKAMSCFADSESSGTDGSSRGDMMGCEAHPIHECRRCHLLSACASYHHLLQIVSHGALTLGMNPVKIAAKSRLQRAAAGTATGSQFRSARSQREERERREADATAEVYASFVASFQADDAEAKTFVRGSTLKDGRETASNSAVSQSYTLKAKASTGSTDKKQNPMVMAFGEDSDSDEEPSSEPRATRGRGAWPQRSAGSTPMKPAASGGYTQLSGMDQMVADMKADADRGVLAGGTAFGDADSTNLFVGNISQGTTEEDLVGRFATHGPLLSAKIMWPRTSAEESRGYNNGFVCFAYREDADAALRALDGASVAGSRLAVSWGKGIAPAAYDALLQAAQARGEDCRPRAQRLKAPRRGVEGGLRGDGRVPRPEETAPPMGPPLGEDHPLMQAARAAAAAAPPSGAALRRVPWPSPPVRRRLLDRTAAFVAVDGYPLEQALIKQEAPRQGSTEYGFLFAPDSPEGMYYRWRVYACVCGEGFQQWRSAPFQMERGGEWWLPPPPPHNHDSGFDSDASWGSWASEGEEGGSRAPSSGTGGGSHAEAMPAQGSRAGKGAVPLTPEDVQTWDGMLSALAPTSEGVGTAMVWGMRHASSASRVVAAVLARLGEGLPSPVQAAPWDTGASSSLGDASVTSAQRLACVYLLGDLLCNAECKAPHALVYARAVQSALPLAFHYLGHLLNEMSVHCGRMSAAGLRERLVRALHAWGGGSMLPPPFLLGLEAAIVWRGASSDAFLQLRGVYAAGGSAACAAVGVTCEDLAAACRQVGCVDEGETGVLLQRLLAVRSHGGSQLSEGSTVPCAVQGVVEGGLHPQEAMAAAQGGGEHTEAAPLPPAVDQDAIPDFSGWKPSIRYNRHRRGAAQKRQRLGEGGDEGGGSDDDVDVQGDEGGGFIRVELSGAPAAAMPAVEALTIAAVRDTELEAAEAAAAALAVAAAADASDSDPGSDWEHAGAVDGGPVSAADEAFLGAAGWLPLPTLPPPPPAPPVPTSGGALALPLPPPPPNPPSTVELGLPPPPQGGRAGQGL